MVINGKDVRKNVWKVKLEVTVKVNVGMPAYNTRLRLSLKFLFPIVFFIQKCSTGH